MRKGPHPLAQKLCPGCQLVKPRSEFYKKLTSISRLCRPCTLADNRSRQSQYIGRYRDSQNRWRKNRYSTDAEYRSRISEQKKARYEKSKDAINAQRRHEWATNPECVARKHNRYHHVARNTPPWADSESINAFYAQCPVGCHVDHIIPLRGLIDGRPVSGLHVLWNLQYLQASENHKKYNRVSEATLFALPQAIMSV